MTRHATHYREKYQPTLQPRENMRCKTLHGVPYCTTQQRTIHNCIGKCATKHSTATCRRSSHTPIDSVFMFQLDIHRSSEPGLQHPWHEKICSSELSSKQHLDCSNTLYSHIASAKSLSNSYVSKNLNSSTLIV